MKPYSLCILGNSHSGAFKQAWSNREFPVAPDFSLTFFAASNFHLENLVSQDGALIPGHADLAEKFRLSSGGKDRIELDQFDAIALIGGNFGIDFEWLCSNEGTVEHLKYGPLKRVVSHACFVAAVMGSFIDTLAVKLIDKIRAQSDIPLILCAKPYPSETLLSTPVFARDPRYADSALLGLVVAQAKEAASRVAKNRNFEILWQDEATVGSPGFTKAEFGLGAVHLNDRKAAPDEDARHMNEEFGYRSLMAAMRRLDAISCGRVFATPTNVVRMKA
jgi:hypothetical protein